MFIQLVVMKLLLPHKSLIEHDLSILSVYFHVNVCEALRGRQEIKWIEAQTKDLDFVAKFWYPAEVPGCPWFKHFG